MILTAFKKGVRSASHNWRMVFLLVITSLLLAAAVATPVMLVITRTASGRPAANDLLAGKLDFVWFADLFNYQFVNESLTRLTTQISVTLGLMIVLHSFANLFFTGGIISILATGDGLFSWVRFWSGARAYFFRFFKLWVISFVPYAALALIYGVVLLSIALYEKQATAERRVVIARWLATGVLLLMIGVINMAFDYARIGTVLGNGARVVPELTRAGRFVTGQFRFVFGLYLLIALVGAALFAMVLLLRNAVEQRSMGFVLLAFLLGQCGVATKAWVRILFYAAQLQVWRRSLETRGQCPERGLSVPPAVAGGSPSA